MDIAHPCSDRLPVLGVDLGGVIVDRAAEGSDTSFFGHRPMDTPAVVDAFDSLAGLTLRAFDWRVFIVSKAGARTAATSRAWLGHTGFHTITGMPGHHVFFVRDREDKRPVCARLGVTHFVDDRLDVLDHLAGTRRSGTCSRAAWASTGRQLGGALA